MSRRTAKAAAAPAGSGERGGEAGPWLAPEDAEPRLLLFLDGPAAAAADPSAWAAALLAARPAALVLGPPAGAAAGLAPWQALARGAGAALLLAGDPGLAADAGADGAFMAGPGGVAAARRRLGPERLIGCAVGLSRHDAMEAGDAGADFVLFGDLERPAEAAGEVADLVAWWSDVVVLPCAGAAPPEPGAVAALARAGADFVALGGPALRDRPGGGEIEGTLAAARAALGAGRDAA